MSLFHKLQRRIWSSLDVLKDSQIPLSPNRATDEDMNSKLPTLIGKAMQEYQKAVKEEKEKQAKKEKQTKKKNR